MQPVIKYEDMLEKLTNAFENRYDNSLQKTRMVGLVFCSPNSKFTKNEILPQINDWHHRSGNYIDFFFAGYTQGNSNLKGYEEVHIPGRDGWIYNSKKFNKFRKILQSETTWKYSGASDLLLVNATYDEINKEAFIDFDTAILCQLNNMLLDNAIVSVEQFFESIFDFSESNNDTNPTWDFSDSKGRVFLLSYIKNWVLSCFSKTPEKDFKKARHLVTKNFTKYEEGLSPYLISVKK